MRVTIVFVIFLAGIIISYFMIEQSAEKKAIKVINPNEVAPEMVDSLLRGKGFGHRIGKFSFLNQDGKLVSEQEVKGKVYVAEYFFTTCGSICPKMNQQMKRVQQAYANENRFRILSFTVDPETDTVAQMKRYSQSMGAKAGRWHFLTGDKNKLYQLARSSFFVLKPAEAANQGDAGGDFIHTNNFVLVDGEGCIRGYYDGTSAKETNQLIADIQTLLDEK